MMPAADAPIDAESQAEALYRCDDSDDDLPQAIRATGVDGRWSMSLEVALRRIWKQFGRFLLFLFSFSSLLFISSLNLGLVQMASARDFTTCQWRRSLPVRRIRRKVAIECAGQLWDLWVLTIAYVG